jgi:hypothetical protein
MPELNARKMRIFTAGKAQKWSFLHTNLSCKMPMGGCRPLLLCARKINLIIDEFVFSLT